MGLWSFLFKKNTEQNTAKDINKNTAEHGCNLQHLKTEIESLHGQINTIHIAVSSHQKLIDRNYTMIKQHTGKLQSLEDKLSAAATKPSTCRDSPIGIGNIKPIEQTPQQRPGKLELSRFTPQEKKILSIFFNDRDMQLSYADIGRTMGKSPHTIKNHIRQMRMKADIFRQNVADEGRKRFQLKDGLEIQNYLNVNHAD